MSHYAYIVSREKNRFGSLLVRASDLRLSRREFDSRLPWSVGTGMDDRLQVSRYTCNQPPRPTQPPALYETGNEYRRQSGIVLRLGVKAGWFIAFVDKRVGGMQVKLCDCFNTCHYHRFKGELLRNRR